MRGGYTARRGFTYRGVCKLHSPYREVFLVRREPRNNVVSEDWIVARLTRGRKVSLAKTGEVCVNVARSIGDQEEPGTQGPPGDKGDTGLNGITGLRGNRGSPGRPGVPGLSGSGGGERVNGLRGFPGNKGGPGPPGLFGSAAALE